MPESSGSFADLIEKFITRWKDAEAAERANYEMCLTELPNKKAKSERGYRNSGS